VANDIGVEHPWGLPESGMELQMTAWAYDREDPLGDAIFKSHRLIWKGTAGMPPNATLQNMYVCQWSDTDVGVSGDDFNGCDSLRNMAYGYNATPSDADYAAFGLVPPASGYDLLQGPLVPGIAGEDRNRNGVDDAQDFGVLNMIRRPGYVNLPMTSSVSVAAGGTYFDPPWTPDGAVQWYQMLRGLPPEPQGPPDPPPVTDPVSGLPTVYWLSGDPITGQGWVDGIIDNPDDRRFLMNAGPFSMAVGDTQEVVTVWIGGIGASHLNSVEVLRSNDDFVQEFFSNSIASDVSAPQPAVPSSPRLLQNYPNPFNPATEIRYDLPEPTPVTLVVYDMLGRVVETLVEERKEAGHHTVRWNAGGISSGVYFYRMTAGAFTETKRMVLVR